VDIEKQPSVESADRDANKLSGENQPHQWRSSQHSEIRAQADSMTLSLR
jgi:hypothetical protein